VNILVVPNLSVRLECFMAMIVVMGVVLQFLHSIRGFWEFWHIDWWDDFWKWSVEEILVRVVYDL
jgi:hypothetical protein